MHLNLLRNRQNRRRATGSSSLLKSSTLNPKLRLKFSRHETNLKTIQEIETKKSIENLGPEPCLSNDSSDSEISDYFSLYATDTFEMEGQGRSQPNNLTSGSEILASDGNKRDEILREIFNSNRKEGVNHSLQKVERNDSFNAKENIPLLQRDIQSLLSISSEEDSSYIYNRSSSISFDEIYHSNGISLSEDSPKGNSEIYFPPIRDGNMIQKELDELCFEDEDLSPIEADVKKIATPSCDEKAVGAELMGVPSMIDHNGNDDSVVTDATDTTDTTKTRDIHSLSPEVRDVGSSERSILMQAEGRTAVSPFPPKSSSGGMRKSLSRRLVDNKYSPLSSSASPSSVHKGIQRVQTIRAKRAGDRIRKKSRKMEAKSKPKHIDISKCPLLSEDSQEYENKPFRLTEAGMFVPHRSLKLGVPLTTSTSSELDIPSADTLNMPRNLLPEFDCPYRPERIPQLPQALSWNSDTTSDSTPLLSNHMLDTRKIQVVNIDSDPRAIAKYCEEKHICESPSGEQTALRTVDLDNCIELSPHISVQGLTSKFPSPIPINNVSDLYRFHCGDSHIQTEHNLAEEDALYQRMIDPDKGSHSSNKLGLVKPISSEERNTPKLKPNTFSAFSPVNSKTGGIIFENDECSTHDLITIEMDSFETSMGSKIEADTSLVGPASSERCKHSPNRRTVSTQTLANDSNITRQDNCAVLDEREPSFLEFIDCDSPSPDSMRQLPFCYPQNTIHVAVKNRPIRTSLRLLSSNGSPRNRSRTLVSAVTAQSLKRISRAYEIKTNSSKIKSEGDSTSRNQSIPKKRGSSLQGVSGYNSRVSNITVSKISSSSPLLASDLKKSGEVKVYGWSHLKASDTLSETAPKSLHFWAMAQKRAHEEKDVYSKSKESRE